MNMTGPQMPDLVTPRMPLTPYNGLQPTQNIAVDNSVNGTWPGVYPTGDRLLDYAQWHMNRFGGEDGTWLLLFAVMGAYITGKAMYNHLYVPQRFGISEKAISDAVYKHDQKIAAHANIATLQHMNLQHIKMDQALSDLVVDDALRGLVGPAQLAETIRCHESLRSKYLNLTVAQSDGTQLSATKEDKEQLLAADIHQRGQKCLNASSKGSPYYYVRPITDGDGTATKKADVVLVSSAQLTVNLIQRAKFDSSTDQLNSIKNAIKLRTFEQFAKAEAIMAGLHALKLNQKYDEADYHQQINAHVDESLQKGNLTDLVDTAARRTAKTRQNSGNGSRATATDDVYRLALAHAFSINESLVKAPVNPDGSIDLQQQVKNRQAFDSVVAGKLEHSEVSQLSEKFQTAMAPLLRQQAVRIAKEVELIYSASTYDPQMADKALGYLKSELLPDSVAELLDAKTAGEFSRAAFADALLIALQSDRQFGGEFKNPVDKAVAEARQTVVEEEFRRQNIDAGTAYIGGISVIDTPRSETCAWIAAQTEIISAIQGADYVKTQLGSIQENVLASCSILTESVNVIREIKEDHGYLNSVERKIRLAAAKEPLCAAEVVQQVWQRYQDLAVVREELTRDALQDPKKVHLYPKKVEEFQQYVTNVTHSTKVQINGEMFSMDQILKNLVEPAMLRIHEEWLKSAHRSGDWLHTLQQAGVLSKQETAAVFHGGVLSQSSLQRIEAARSGFIATKVAALVQQENQQQIQCKSEINTVDSGIQSLQQKLEQLQHNPDTVQNRNCITAISQELIVKQATKAKRGEQLANSVITVTTLNAFKNDGYIAAARNCQHIAELIAPAAGESPTELVGKLISHSFLKPSSSGGASTQILKLANALSAHHIHDVGPLFVPSEFHEYLSKQTKQSVMTLYNVQNLLPVDRFSDRMFAGALPEFAKLVKATTEAHNAEELRMISKTTRRELYVAAYESDKGRPITKNTLTASFEEIQAAQQIIQRTDKGASIRPSLRT